MHSWHANNNALFEDVGQWKRSWYYPKKNETMNEAVNREVKATRDSLGILDASTLGKIDLKGRDVSEFLKVEEILEEIQLLFDQIIYGIKVQLYMITH